jgi:hypothetical protein
VSEGGIGGKRRSRTCWIQEQSCHNVSKITLLIDLFASERNPQGGSGLHTISILLAVFLPHQGADVGGGVRDITEFLGLFSKPDVVVDQAMSSISYGGDRLTWESGYL